VKNHEQPLNVFCQVPLQYNTGRSKTLGPGKYASFITLKKAEQHGYCIILWLPRRCCYFFIRATELHLVIFAEEPRRPQKAVDWRRACGNWKVERFTALILQRSLYQSVVEGTSNMICVHIFLKEDS